MQPTSDEIRQGKKDIYQLGELLQAMNCFEQYKIEFWYRDCPEWIFINPDQTS